MGRRMYYPWDKWAEDGEVHTILLEPEQIGDENPRAVYERMRSAMRQWARRHTVSVWWSQLGQLPGERLEDGTWTPPRFGFKLQFGDLPKDVALRYFLRAGLKEERVDTSAWELAPIAAKPTASKEVE